MLGDERPDYWQRRNEGFGEQRKRYFPDDNERRDSMANDRCQFVEASRHQGAGKGVAEIAIREETGPSGGSFVDNGLLDFGCRQPVVFRQALRRFTGIDAIGYRSSRDSRAFNDGSPETDPRVDRNRSLAEAIE